MYSPRLYIGPPPLYTHIYIDRESMANAKNSTKSTAARIAKNLASLSLAANVPANPSRSTPRGAQNPRRRLRGRGGYYADEGAILGFNTGAKAGGHLGAFAGRTAGSFLDTLVGRGDYSVKKNSIMTHSAGVPTFTHSRMSRDDHSIILEHREFVCDVVAPGTTQFSRIATYDLQPALSAPLAYASQLASSFEEWEPEGLVWCFESTSGSITTTQGLGTVIVATQYDVNDLPFTSQVEMLDYMFSSSACPDTSFCHPVECDPRQNASTTRLYTRTAAGVGNANLYDLGKTTIALAGVPAAAGVVLGKMWLSYKIRLIKPKLYSSILGNAIGYVSLKTNTSVAYNTPFGQPSIRSAGIGSLYNVAPNFTINSQVGFTGNQFTNNAVYFGPGFLPGGTYRAMFQWGGDVAPTAVLNTTTAFATLTYGGCKASTANRLTNDTLNYFAMQSTVTTKVILIVDVEVAESNGAPLNDPVGRSPWIQLATFFPAANTFPSGNVWAECTIMQIPNISTD